MAFNIADLFEYAVDAAPERTAVVADGVRRTYADLEGRANRLAHHLAEGGIGPGDHVGVYAYNSAEFVEAMLAAYKLRAVAINVNYRYVDEELAYLFDNADVVAVVHDAEFATTVERVRKTSDGVRLALDTRDGYEEAVGAASADRDFGTRSADDRYVLYTGGTTGMPKGVVWRHEDIFFAAMGGGNPGGPPIARPEEIVPSVLDNAAQRLRPFLPADD